MIKHIKSNKNISRTWFQIPTEIGKKSFLPNGLYRYHLNIDVSFSVKHLLFPK